MRSAHLSLRPAAGWDKVHASPDYDMAPIGALGKEERNEGGEGP